MDNTEVTLKIKNSITGEKKLEEYEKRLQNIYSFINGLNSGQTKAFSKIESSTKNLNNEINLSNKSIEKMGRQFNLAFNLKSITAYTYAVTNLAKKIMGLTQASSDYIENVNLLEVAYHNSNESIEESSSRIEEFIDKMAEVYGFDESRLTRQFGVFKQLANAMKLPQQEAENLSELMVKMTNDVASLYNLSLDRASNALQSALVGQVRPIRGATGADITEKTLQQTVDKLGLEQSISDLSFVEKRLIMVISLTDQLKNSQGDYARTIESASNQIRVMHEQWDRLSRAVGNVFYPIIAKVLPYINAVLMVLTEIFNLVASFLGFKMPEFDYSGLAGTSDAVMDLEDNLNGAGESADKLKQKMSGLRGFDKLNVISTPKNKGDESAGSGINPKIMDAFNNAFSKYNDMLDEVNMKATKIRDRIMEWLGFSKILDENGNLIGWKYEGISKTIKNMVDSWKKLSVPMKIISALGLGLTFVNIYRALKGIAKLTGIDKLFMSIATAGKFIAKFSGLKSLFDAIKVSFSLLVSGEATFAEVITQLILPALGEFALTLGGIIAIGAGIYELFKGIGSIIENGWNFDGIAEALTGISLIVGGILLFINPIGGAIALAIAGVIKLVQLIVDNWGVIKQTVINPIVNFIKQIGETIYNSIIKPIVDFYTPIATIIYDMVIRPIMDFFKQMLDVEIKLFKYTFDKISEIVVGIGTAIGSIISKIVEIFTKIVEIYVALEKAFLTYIVLPIFNKVKSAFSFIYQNIISPIISLALKVGKWFYDYFVKPIHDKLIWIRDKAIGIFKTVGITVVDFISGLFKSVINGILASIEKNINKFIKSLNGAIKLINNIPGVDIKRVDELKIPRLEKGIDFVPKDFYGPVYLDYGERVLTKQENRDYAMNNRGNNFTYSNGTTQSQPMNATFVIQVGSKEVARQVITDLQGMAKSNGKPITIG